MSLFPLISEPDTGELTGSDGLPLYREVDWDFRTNKPVWKGGNPVYVTGGARRSGVGVECAAHHALQPRRVQHRLRP